MHLPVSNMENLNSRPYLDKIKDQLFDILGCVSHRVCRFVGFARLFIWGFGGCLSWQEWWLVRRRV